MNTENSSHSNTAPAAQEQPATQARQATPAAQDQPATQAPPTRERNYIAFISYRHTPLDKEAAERVQKKIESYTIPKEFRAQYGGKKFGHAFRDEDELPTSASLTDSIYYALDHSKYLVVICTPNLPQSKWCEAEIRYFLKKHGRDHVIAVLADGSPEESFSPYMLHEFDSDGNPIADFEPLAANIAGPNHTINRKALNKEIVRLYATFLDCPFDSLWQRQRRARTNRLLSIAGIAIAVLCVFLAVVLNKNAQIEEQNEQIAAQNDQLTEQNEKIEEQNTELQSRLSSVLVDSGLTKLEQHDVTGALKDAISSLESGDPSVYDHRVGKLMSDTLCAYHSDEMRSSVIYEQSTGIERIALSADQQRLLLLDNVGVLRCFDLTNSKVAWEYPTGSKDSCIYAGIPGSRVIIKSLEGAFCLSLADGSVLWSHERTDYFGNNFQTISEDGTLFAVIDVDNSANQMDLVILGTDDGSERGRISLLDDEGFKPTLTMIDSAKAYAGAFSPDNTRFVFGIPGDLEETGESGNRFYVTDLETLSKTKIGTTGTKYRYFYGIDIDPEDDSVYIAVYTLSSIYTILCTKNGDSYEFNNHHETHSFSSPGGISMLVDYFDKNECRFLSLDGRVYIFSDNQVFIYDRGENTLGHNYSMTGAIINAYWVDRENHVLEMITDDAYIVDYFLDYSEGMIISGVQGEKADQSTMSKACPSGKGSVVNGGSYYNTSSDAPGRVYLADFVSDPHAEHFHPKTDDYDFSDNYEFLLSDTSDYGLLIYNSYYASTFDKKTGGIKKTAKFEDYLLPSEIVLIDEDHFLNGQTRCSMDGTTEKAAEPVFVGSYEDYPSNHIRLSDGRILSYKDMNLFGYKQEGASSDDSFGSYGLPQFCAVWLDGKPVESLCSPEGAVLIYDSDVSPLTAAGANGLILQRGVVIDLKDPEAKTYTVRDKNELFFIDALSGKITFIEDANPGSSNLKTAFAAKTHLCAAAYDDGTVCLYDVDSAACRSIGEKYNADEIAGICFSSDDAYLLIVTSAGRLDVYEVGGAGAAAEGADDSAGAESDAGGAGTETTGSEAAGINRTFSAVIDLYQQNSTSLGIYDLTAYKAAGSDALLVTLNSWCTVIETDGWHEISEFTGSAAKYDPVSERVYFKINLYADSSYSGSDIISYPVYDIAKLKEWAEKEVAGK